jgi:hypothetical protein
MLEPKKNLLLQELWQPSKQSIGYGSTHDHWNQQQQTCKGQGLSSDLLDISRTSMASYFAPVDIRIKYDA